MNEDFRNRGARIEEQVEVLRALWTQPVITFRGRWHQIDEAGINPLVCALVVMITPTTMMAAPSQVISR